MINEESLNLINNKGDNIEEESLFNHTSVEDLSFSEPTKNQVNTQSVFEEQQSVVREESIDFIAPVQNGEQDVETEVLFGSVEDLQSIENPTISEESIEFEEPVKIEIVKEETLFDVVEESVEETLETLVDNSIIEDSIIDGDVTDAISFTEEEKVKIVYEDKSFAEKMFEQEPIILERYAELKNVILSYKKVKSRISTNYDSFNQGRLQLFKISTTGKSLKLFMNIDFNEVESRLKCKDVSDKKAYKEVPTLLKIKSDRAMKNAKYLIDLVAKKHNLQLNNKFEPVNAVQILKDYINN